jgi:tetratricopeptide (TPR) repeat protein
MREHTWLPATIFIIALAVLSVYRNQVWTDNYTLWKDSLLRSPSKPRVLVNFATSAMALKKNKEALDAFRKAIQIDPTTPLGLVNYGLFLKEMGSDKEAEEVLSMARGAPNAEVVLMGDAKLLQDMGRYPEALEKYREVLATNPVQAKALSGIGVILEETGDREEAMRYYRMAVETDPDVIQAWFGLGKMLRLSGRQEEAIKAYGEAARRAPYMAEAWNNYGAILAEAGRKKEAVEALEKALGLDPGADMIKRNIERLKASGP